jgi:hypothetical protein
MAKYDQGGGCPCGLYRECELNCEHHPDKEKARMAALEQKLREKEVGARSLISIGEGAVTFKAFPEGVMRLDILTNSAFERTYIEPEEIGALIRWLLDNYTAPREG